MAPKEMRPSFDDSMNATVPAGPYQISREWQISLNTAPEVLVVRRHELAAARAEYLSGHYLEAKELLTRLSAALPSPPIQSSGAEHRSAAQAGILLGGAKSLLGQIHHELGDEQMARLACEEAVTLFDVWLPRPEAGGQAIVDYAEALLILGEEERAVDQLEAAVLTDEPPAAAFRELGLHRLRQGNHERALELLEEAARRAPDDYRNHTALAEAIEARDPHRREDALRQYRQAALTAAAANRPEEALAALGHALRLQPDDAELNTLQVELMLRTGKTEEGLAALDRALALNPDDVRLLTDKVLILQNLARNEEALAAVNRLLELNPNDAWTLPIKGEVLHALELNKEALAAFDQALALDDSMAWVHAARGDTLRMLGDNKEALEALNEALRLSPGHAWAIGTKGQVLHAMGDNEKALDTLDEALALDDSMAWAHAERGDTLRMLGRNKEALEALDEALALDSSMAWVHATRGETLRVLGRNEEALAALEQALAPMPDDVWSLSIKALVLNDLNRNEEALAALDQVLGQRQDDSWALATRATTLMELERPTEALLAVDEALKWTPDDPSVLATKGRILCEVADYESAIPPLDRAIELDPERAECWYLNGWALEHMMPARLLEAQQHYARAVELDPEAAWYRSKLADVLYLQDQSREAEKIFRSIIDEVKKRDADVHDLDVVAMCHFRLEQYDQAIRVLSKALALRPDWVFVQFDLALSIMGSGRCPLALTEYQRGVDQARDKEALIRRGVFDVALYDLRIAMDRLPRVSKSDEVHKAYRLLETEHRKAEQEVLSEVRPGTRA
jgi:tetratricopeptide (TPR) repeat protein